MKLILFFRKSLFVVFSLWTLVALSGCEFKDVELEEVEEFTVNSMKGGKLDGTLRLRLTNPNMFAITVKEAEFELFTGSSKLGEATLKEPFKISGNSTKSYQVDVQGSFGNLLAAGLAGLSGLLGGEDPEMLIKGDLRVGNFMVSKRVQIEERTALPVQFN